MRRRHYLILRSDRGLQSLTRKQYRLFQALRTHGSIVSDGTLIATIWGHMPSDSDVHSLRVLVHALRGALSGSRFSVQRHSRRGYELVTAPRPRTGQTEPVALIEAPVF